MQGDENSVSSYIHLKNKQTNSTYPRTVGVRRNLKPFFLIVSIFLSYHFKSLMV